MTLHLPPILVLVLVQWVGADPELEIGAWVALYGVPVAVALAVAETETGNVPETRRDSVVSRGNVGRCQVNATEWVWAHGADVHRNSRGEWVCTLTGDSFTFEGRGALAVEAIEAAMSLV